MIPRAKRLPAQTLQRRFMELLPQIQNQASLAFRHEKPERREELIAEVLANSFVAFVRLMETGREGRIFATPLAQYAIRQVRDGRRVGSSLNIKDVSSGYAQQRKGIVMESLDRFDKEANQWQEAIVEDRHAGPAETAAARIDVGEWFASLPRRQRKIAKALGNGERTKEVAKRFGVSAGRISQLRREMARAWFEFIGDDEQAAVATTA